MLAARSYARAVFEDLALAGTWRRYQTLALEAFERDRAAGRRRTHVIAPPGSGKTLVGLEMVRRLGDRALVLVPNTSVQAQWIGAGRRFGAGDGVIGPDPSAPIAALTYQSLCRLDDPSAALDGLAERRWADERAAATGQTVDEVTREASAWRGEAAARRRRSIRRISSALKREIARAEHGALHLGHLLGPGARARIDALCAAGVSTLVLDECHHLASMWGYVVRAAIEELGDVHVIGLTATPPDELTREHGELYRALLGPVDMVVPTPAVVRDGYLAPDQELAWFTSPLPAERRWLAEHDLRFRELVTALHADAEGPLSFPGWVLMRLRDRGTGDGEAEVPWSTFQRAHPALARAGARFLVSAGLPLPPGAPHGEGYREDPSLEDWLVLLEDYVLRCLSAHPSTAAAERLEAIAAALRDLGYTVTRRGIRRGASDADRLLMGSGAKLLALAAVLGGEFDARGGALRALVLVDAEQRSAADGALVAVLPAQAGTAPQAVRALASDVRTEALRPLLVSGRGLRCCPEDAPALLEALRSHAPAGLAGWRAERDGDGLARLLAAGGEWGPRLWVPLATAALAAGATRALVGTRALLGEGWDAPCVNCLVDLTAATTSVSVTQMRGRSLRLDPADPEKIASNWDVVCVAADVAGGDADYRRFARKHAHLFAPSEDGEIEAGPSHVHPALSPFAPPAADDLDEINRTMLARAAAHDRARERWRIGEPYAAEEHDTIVVRQRRGVPVVRPPDSAPPDYRARHRAPVAAGAVAALAAGASAAAAGEPLLLAAAVLLPAGAAWSRLRLARARSLLHERLPLDLAARAIRDAYVELGELPPAATVVIEPRAGGYLRVRLDGASPAASAAFADAFAEVVEPADAPRYVVSRPVPTGTAGALALAGALVRRQPFAAAWSAVPRDLARRRDRAATFAACWERWLGPGSLRFTQRSKAGREALALASAQAGGSDARRRRVWR